MEQINTHNDIIIVDICMLTQKKKLFTAPHPYN